MEDPAREGWQPHVDDTYVSNMGAVFERRGDQGIEIALQTDKRHVNLSGIVQGGIVMTLIDRTLGLNCRAVADGQRLVTASLTVNFLRQVMIGDFLRITCRVRKKGRKSYFIDADAWVEDRLVATAMGLCLTVG